MTEKRYLSLNLTLMMRQFVTCGAQIISFEESRQKQAIGNLVNEEAANHDKGKLKRLKGVAWRAQIRKRIKCNGERNQKFSKYSNSNEYFMRENTIALSVFAQKKK